MLYITTQHKYIKRLRIVATIVFMPIRLPLLLFYKIGEISESICNKVDNFYYTLEDNIAKKYRWDDIARAEYDAGKLKVK